MSFLDLYQGDIDEASKIQPNEGSHLPTGFDENLHAAWSDGQLFSQSIAHSNARTAVLGDYVDEIRQKTGQDLSKVFIPDVAGGGQTGVTNFDQANERVTALKKDYPDLDLAPLSEDEIDRRAVAKAQAAHQTYQSLQAGERTTGGAIGSFLGSAGAAAADPINILALGVAPEAQGISVLSSALRWGALAGVSQAAIEAASDTFKEQVQPGYQESGQPLREIGGAFVGGAVLGGGIKALGNAWTRVKTGAWPTSVRDAGNVIESEANVAQTNIFPGAEGEVAHKEALTKTIDDVLAGRPVDVSQQITPEMAKHIEAYHGSPHDFDAFDMSKIGSGEGAQAYGHGLYFSESPDVAGVYKERLAQKQAPSGGAPAGEAEVRHEDGMWNVYVDGELQNAFGAKSDADRYANRGSLYGVKIIADKEHFLDLDKPLTDQSEHVRTVLSNLNIPDEMNGKPLSGADAYRRVGVAVGPKEMNDTIGREVAASKALSDAGIPGSKYLDQGSRGGEGTHNLVVFNDKHIEITHKNGKPVNAETRQNVVDHAMGLPPKQPELPLEPATAETVPPEAPARVRVDKTAPQPALQTADQMAETLSAPDHQDAIRADIDRARAMGDVQVPGVDENGNHTMIGVDKAMDQVDAYKKLADDIQACASPPAEEEAA